MLMYLAGLVSGVVLTVLSLAIWLWPDGTIRLPKIETYRPAPWKPREPAPPPSLVERLRIEVPRQRLVNQFKLMELLDQAADALEAAQARGEGPGAAPPAQPPANP